MTICTLREAYLTEEFVTLALFSSIVPVEEKKEIADKINKFGWQNRFTCQNRDVRQGMKNGKAVIPAVLIDAKVRLALADFVDEDSSMAFTSLIVNPWFLAKRVEDWEDDESYQETMIAADNLVVVNDAAESVVKLCHDFGGGGRGNRRRKRFQDVLQVVQNSRNRMPKMRKLKEE